MALNKSKIPQTVFIAGISSDIGQALAQIWLDRGCKVVGTYRNECNLGEQINKESIITIKCDLSSQLEINNVAETIKNLKIQWDLYLSAIGGLDPIGPFFSLDGGDWAQSVMLNGTNQLALLNAVFPYRTESKISKLVFLVGGAINRAFPNYSAYSLGKICLVKFCELIHEEYEDVHAVALGTGWVATKIHNQTIKAGDIAGENFNFTAEFLNNSNNGTSMEDIMGCIDWCFEQDRNITGGRNFSIVHDGWRNGGDKLKEELLADPQKFRLRRYANN